MSVLGYHDSDDDDEDGILYSVRLLEMDPEVSLRREALAELRAQDELPPDFPSDEHLAAHISQKAESRGGPPPSLTLHPSPLPPLSL